MEKERRVAGERESRRVQRSKIEGKEDQDVERETQRSGRFKAGRGSARPQPLPCQQYGGKAEETKCPRCWYEPCRPFAPDHATEECESQDDSRRRPDDANLALPAGRPLVGCRSHVRMPPDVMSTVPVLWAQVALRTI